MNILKYSVTGYGIAHRKSQLSASEQQLYDHYCDSYETLMLKLEN